MFWTIFFAVLAALCAPVLLMWALAGAVCLAGFVARLRPYQRDGFVDFLWFAAIVIGIGTALFVAAGTR